MKAECLLEGPVGNEGEPGQWVMDNEHTQLVEYIPSDRGEYVGELSFVGEPASAKPRRFEMDGSVHLTLDSICGEGGLAKLCCPTGKCDIKAVISQMTRILNFA